MWFYFEKSVNKKILNYFFIFFGRIYRVASEMGRNSDFRRFFPSDFRKNFNFRVPTFEQVPISVSSDFRHLWLFRHTSVWHVRDPVLGFYGIPPIPNFMRQTGFSELIPRDPSRSIFSTPIPRDRIWQLFLKINLFKPQFSLEI